MLKNNKIWLFCLIGLIVTACSISYKFNGASIDYTKVKTITIKDFPNQAPLVYPPLSQKFTEALKDIYIRQTRLQLVNSNGDLDLEGEITGYDLCVSDQADDYGACPLFQPGEPGRRFRTEFLGLSRVRCDSDVTAGTGPVVGRDYG